MKYEITYFSRINLTTNGLRIITVQDAIDIIRDGNLSIYDHQTGKNTTLRDITDRIQHLPAGTDLQTLKFQYLPAVSFNGVYNNGIVQYSNVTALDFDHISTQEEYDNLYLRLMETPCVGWIYRTPSGRGLKALVLHDNTDMSMHGNMYQQLMQKFQTPYIKTDPKCKDLSRRNYICYDPDVWSNPRPVPYHFTYDASFDQPTPITLTQHTAKAIQQPLVRVKPIISQGLPSDASVMCQLKSSCKRYHPEYLKEGARRDGVFWFGTQASRAGVDYQYGLDFVTKLYQSNAITLTSGGAFTVHEIRENYSNGYNTKTYDEEYRKKFRKH